MWELIEVAIQCQVERPRDHTRSHGEHLTEKLVISRVLKRKSLYFESPGVSAETWKSSEKMSRFANKKKQNALQKTFPIPTHWTTRRLDSSFSFSQMLTLVLIAGCILVASYVYWKALRVSFQTSAPQISRLTLSGWGQSVGFMPGYRPMFLPYNFPGIMFPGTWWSLALNWVWEYRGRGKAESLGAIFHWFHFSVL